MGMEESPSISFLKASNLFSLFLVVFLYFKETDELVTQNVSKIPLRKTEVLNSSRVSNR